ncbi:MAG: glutamate synthase subunit beta [Fibrobacteria bacterium]|nr:glutamate synthase subunit beta [Fibrobacteria bacterium]
MGKPSGFLDYKRKTPTHLKVPERIKNFKEFSQLQPLNEMIRQGARCMDCGVPYCHAVGCPIVNLIPEWNDYVYHNNWYGAYKRLEKTNNFPEITGRVCPAPCETACTLSINNSPVSIKQIELSIIENAYAEGWVQPKPPLQETGKRIAIIGSGPAGLAAAQQLRRAGHTVTVYEKASKIGGILRYGIPNYKLDKRIIDRRLLQMVEEGVKFESNVDIGKDLSSRYLKRTHDVILLAVGAREPRDLPVTGRDLKGIHFALEYLTKATKCVCGELTEKGIISAKGKNVLVIGGGDTGSDCIGTARRQGAKNIYQFEILPKPNEWTKDWNPDWPYWPNILRTSSAHEEGCERDWSILTKKFEGHKGTLRTGEFSRIEWSKDPDTGKFSFEEIPGSNFSLDIDLVFLAMGFVHPRHNQLLDDLQVELNERGNIKVDENYATSSKQVFSAGDAHSGASLVVRAINHGRKAAACINEYLQKKN